MTSQKLFSYPHPSMEQKRIQ
uniref:Uncharacterized protein n=1 Tax=Rhizophora mucronata TaxID=61149 RepID=A0A2P2LTE7_RHIMU